jgi:hypothetical protein
MLWQTDEIGELCEIGEFDEIGSSNIDVRFASNIKMEESKDHEE